MSDLLRVVVLGGGIRGAAITAFLSASELAYVSLIEPRDIGSGASSSNHGRFHVGTWNYYENDPEIIKVNKESYKLLLQLPNATDSTEWACYCFETKALANNFVNFCNSHKIFYRPIQKSSINRTWCDIDLIECAIEIPEFSFNPARLSARLVEAALRLGNCSVYKSEARRIDLSNKSFKVYLTNGDYVEADLVINTMGNWSRRIQSELPLPKLEITLQRWEMLCFSCTEFNVPPLNRILTLQTKDRKFIGLLPHGDWVVFGCDVNRNTVESEEKILESHFLKRFDNAVENERNILAAHQSYIPVLQRNLIQHIYSFTGVYSEITEKVTSVQGRPTPYSSHCIHKSDDVKGYLLVFGGSATSALFDATKVFDEIFSKSESADIDYVELLRRIVVHIPDPNFGKGMLWEQGNRI